MELQFDNLKYLHLMSLISRYEQPAQQQQQQQQQQSNSTPRSTADLMSDVVRVWRDEEAEMMGWMIGVVGGDRRSRDSSSSHHHLLHVSPHHHVCRVCGDVDVLTVGGARLHSSRCHRSGRRSRGGRGRRGLWVCGFCCQVLSGRISNLHRHAHSIHLCGRWPCPVCGCCYEATTKGDLRYHVRRLHPDGVLHKNPLSIRGCRHRVRPPPAVVAVVAEWHDVESVIPVIRDPDVLDDDDDDVLELSCGMSGCDVVCDSHSLLKRHVRRHHSAVHSSFVGDVELCGVGWMCGWCCGRFGSRRVRDLHVLSVHLGVAVRRPL